MLIAIGTSWGGLNSLPILLSGLPATFDVPIVVVQHRLRDHDAGILEVLNRVSPLPVVEVEDKQALIGGRVHLAPSDYHLLVDRDELSLSTDAPVWWARPSIDVLFETASEAYRKELVAIVLTGAGKDGAQGLRTVKVRGGFTVVEDPATAQVSALPEAAIAAVQPDRVLPLKEIAPFLLTHLLSRRR